LEFGGKRFRKSSELAENVPRLSDSNQIFPENS